MQLSRSLFAVIAMSSLLSIPVKAVEINWRLVGAGALGLGVAYLQKRQVSNAADPVSKVLDTGAKVVQGTTNLAQSNLTPALVGGFAAFVAYHHKHVHHTNLVHHFSHWLHAHVHPK